MAAPQLARRIPPLYAEGRSRLQTAQALHRSPNGAFGGGRDGRPESLPPYVRPIALGDTGRFRHHFPRIKLASIVPRLSASARALVNLSRRSWMTPINRRGFLTDVGRGMLVAGVGTSLASDLGYSAAFAEQGSDSIALGEHARLVEL